MNILKKINLKNKSILIVGGSGLLGSKIVELLNDFDCKIFNYDIIPLSEKFKNVNFFKINLKNLNNSIIRINKAIKSKNIKPDIFINCSYPISEDWIKNSFKKIKIKSFEHNIKIHLNSYCMISKIIADEMVKNKKGGNILLFSSLYGVVAQDQNVYKNTNLSENLTYGVIKSGIIGHMKQMASYYGDKKIRVNTISPGLVIGHVKGSKKNQDKVFKKNYFKKTPYKKICLPENISTSVLFLISNLSENVTGQNLIVDNGYSII